MVPSAQRTVLIVHGDIFLRHAVAEYLRSCGLRVVEAASTDEAFAVLGRLEVNALLGDDATPGTRSAADMLALARNQKPELHIIEITGSRERVASAAAKLCRDNASERSGPSRRS